MAPITAEELKTKSIEELAALGSVHHHRSAYGILINNEIERRRLTMISPAKNKRISKALLAILIGVVSSLIAGILLILYWPK